jgi:hypothetical protein
MPQVIKPQNVNITTRDGEITVRLVIDLNLNLGGGVVGMSVASVASADQVPEQKQMAPKPAEAAEWMIPEFTPSTETIEFGKYDK